MQPRMNPYTTAPDIIQPMLDLAKKLSQGKLEHSLVELVKTRASQMNGCAFCLHMHTSDARAAGETEQRLYLLDAWRESSLYTTRERAALAWTEALTLITSGHAPDHVYEEVRSQFSEEEMVELTLQITTINAWNRIAIGFRSAHPHDLKKACAA